MNFLNICNQVLTKLRKTNLTSSTFATDTYGLLIQQFVNEAKQEVEDSWDWSMLRKKIQVTTDGSNQNFTLTGATQRSRLLDGYNHTQKFPLQMVSMQDMRQWVEVTSSPTGHAEYFTLTADAQITDNTMSTSVWPYTTASDVLNFYFVVPQADLSAYTDNLYIPERSVINLAYVKAIRERGEDAGVSFVDAYGEFEKSLAQAIAQDVARLGDSADWKVM